MNFFYSFPNFNLTFVHIRGDMCVIDNVVLKEFICLDSILQQSSSEIPPTQETDMIHFTGTFFYYCYIKSTTENKL